jgi:hypothetical protein
MVEFDQLIKAYGTVIDALEIEVGEVRDVGVPSVLGNLDEPPEDPEKGTAEDASAYFRNLNKQKDRPFR